MPARYDTESNVSLQDALLAFAPLDVGHVRRCNAAEAEFWRLNEGYRTLPSDKLLQFDCGGQVRTMYYKVTFDTKEPMILNVSNSCFIVAMGF